MNYISVFLFIAFLSVSFWTEASIKLNDWSKLEVSEQQVSPIDSSIVGYWNLTGLVSVVDNVRGEERGMSGAIWQFSESGEFKIMDGKFGTLAEGTYTVENDSVFVEYWGTNMTYFVKELTASRMILAQTMYEYEDAKMVGENILIRRDD